MTRSEKPHEYIVKADNAEDGLKEVGRALAKDMWQYLGEPWLEAHEPDASPAAKQDFGEGYQCGVYETFRAFAEGRMTLQTSKLPKTRGRSNP